MFRARSGLPEPKVIVDYKDFLELRVIPAIPGHRDILVRKVRLGQKATPEIPDPKDCKDYREPREIPETRASKEYRAYLGPRVILETQGRRVNRVSKESRDRLEPQGPATLSIYKP